MTSNLDIIFYSKNNCALGEKIRDYFRKLNKGVAYCNAINQVVERIQNLKNCIVFIDKKYRQYIKMLSEILMSDLKFLNCARFVFIDDDFEFYADYVNNKNIFCIPLTNFNLAMQGIIYTCNMLNYRTNTLNSALNRFNESISNYLIKLGFSYKLSGFRYIKQSVEQGIKNNFSLGSLQKDIYPYVARQNDTNPFNIERGIRMAIKSAAKNVNFKNELNILNESEISNRSFLGFLLDKFKEE